MAEHDPYMPQSDPEADREPGGFFAWFTRNGVASMLLMFALIVGGLLALFGGSVRTEVFPEVSPQIVTVTIIYPGASPTEVEQGALIRIEEAVSGITGVDKVSANAAEGTGSVTVEALTDADLTQVYNDVKNRVDAITTFPDEVEEPVIAQMVIRKEVINVALYGAASERALKELGEDFRDRLTALPQISQVELTSARPYEISIELSESAMRRYGMTFDEVAGARREPGNPRPATARRHPSVGFRCGVGSDHHRGGRQGLGGEGG